MVANVRGVTSAVLQIQPHWDVWHPSPFQNTILLSKDSAAPAMADNLATHPLLNKIHVDTWDVPQRTCRGYGKSGVYHTLSSENLWMFGKVLRRKAPAHHKLWGRDLVTLMFQTLVNVCEWCGVRYTPGWGHIASHVQINCGN